MKMFICENCGKQFEEGYGKRNRFCTRSCCSSYSAKRSWSNPTEKRMMQLQSMRNVKKSKSFLEKEEKEGTCRFCGRICKNQNSLRNHERLCRSNPEYENNIKVLFTAKKIKSYKSKKGTLCAQLPVEVTCRFCGKKWTSTKSGYSNHENHCNKNPNKKDGTFKGKHHSEESKKKTSETQKRNLKEGKVFGYKLNHSSKVSYPEKYFMEVFKSLPVKYNYQVGLYQLDFAIPEKKVYVEIDGDQHYTDKRIVAHDIERTQKLKELGWECIERVRWSHYKKLGPEEQKEYCNKLIDLLKADFNKL